MTRSQRHLLGMRGSQDNTKSGRDGRRRVRVRVDLNLSCKFEYLYVHFGTDNVATLPGVFTADEDMNLQPPRSV